MKTDQLSESNNRSHGSNDYRCSFEIFKSNVCHRVKDLGDLNFIVEVLESEEIRHLYNKKWYQEALYLLAMLDYLSRLNDIPICTNYNDIRSKKLKAPRFSDGVQVFYAVTGDENIKKEAIAKAIPEFMRFNIVESEVRNVY